MRGTPYVIRVQSGLFTPKAGGLGVDLAGRVEAVGENATQFHPGDDVFGAGDGAFAEYICVAEDALALKPAGLTFEQAAAVPIAAFTALQGLRDKGRIHPGQKVLVNGASGGVGTFAVQIAKAFGAEVTGVCGTRNVDMVRSIGADHVIDYTRDDFTRTGERYDLMFDTVGNRSLSECRRVLTSAATCVLVGGPNGGRWLGPIAHLLRTLVSSLFVSQKVVPLLAARSNDDLLVLKELLEAGEVTPVIDRTYPLSQVPEAICYLEEGRARGKVVITV
jgi:NADPH:quinone reductase-like Zn-dependent oxidoreductase